jgi:hypothetical protein
MYRNIMDEMAIWFDSKDRKMLYIKGAYGVGKTWSVRDFATAFFDDSYLLDFREEQNPERLLADIDEWIAVRFPDQDLTGGLLIFDEIDRVDGSLEVIHGYALRHPELTICAISSCVKETPYEALHKQELCSLILKPMCFQEYLIANKETKLIERIENLKVYKLSAEQKQRVVKYLREFLVIGGMPEVVAHFLKHRDYAMAGQLQKDILERFEHRMKQRYGAVICTRTRRILRSIPKQLTNDNKKFRFSLVERNARAREYQEALSCLLETGMVLQLKCIREAKLPLADYASDSVYEVFVLDHGLLHAIAQLPDLQDSEDETAVEDLFGALNGGYGEQFVMSELLGNPNVGELYYWVSGATARVPLVFEGDEDIIPVDIRFSANSKAQNLRVFNQKYKTMMSMRLSMEDMYFDTKILNIPVYGLWNF